MTDTKTAGETKAKKNTRPTDESGLTLFTRDGNEPGHAHANGETAADVEAALDALGDNTQEEVETDD